MTETEWETEWETETSPEAMIYFSHSRGMVTERIVRLFACACARRVWDLMVDERSRKAIEFVESWADGEASSRLRKRFATAAWEATQEHSTRASQLEGRPEAAIEWAKFNAASCAQWACGKYFDHSAAISNIAGCCSNGVGYAVEFSGNGSRKLEVLLQTGLVRCIFGNPFRPAKYDPAWRSEAVVSIAQAAYDSREFGNLPILADALQDAGCDDELILTHLRGPGPHARGCWVLDLILGKA